MPTVDYRQSGKYITMATYYEDIYELHASAD